MLLAPPCYARMTTVVVGGSVAVAPAAGTWYYGVDTYTETGSGDMSQYQIGDAITIGAATNITAIAFKVRAKGDATEMKIGLYAHTKESAITPLAFGTCTPADTSWCIVSVSYTGDASTTYYVAGMANAANLTTYSDSTGTDGFYSSTRLYADWNGATTSTLYTDANTLHTAICAGGTCTGP